MSGNNRWGKFVSYCTLTCIVLFTISRFYFRLTDDFRLGNITYAIPYHPEWETPLHSEAEKKFIDTILDQNFFYLGKGSQSYAFSSEDGRYVLKFFKFKHLQPSYAVKIIPSIAPFTRYKKKIIEKKQRKLEQIFNAYKLAYDVEKEECGLLYAQLNGKNGLARQVTVVDKIGVHRTLSLSAIPFVIQEKGLILRGVVNELLEKGDLAQVKLRFRQVLDLYHSEYKKGVYDHDHGVMHNVGFVGDRPIHLDVGKLLKEEGMRRPEIYSQDIALVAQRMEKWLRNTHPKECQEIMKDVREKIAEMIAKDLVCEQQKEIIK